MLKVEGIVVLFCMCEVENIEFINDGGLGISVYVGKYKGSVFIVDFSLFVFVLVVEKVVDIVCYISEDLCIGLVDVELMVMEFFDLELYYLILLDF